MSALLLDDLKAHLNITNGDNDIELQDTLDAAESYVAGRLGVPLGTGTQELVVYPNGNNLVLPVTRLTAVTSVTDPDGNPVDLEPGAANLLAGIIDLPYRGHYRHRHPRPWRVTVAMSTVIPEDLRLATLIIAGHLWQTQRVPGVGEGRPPGFGGGATGNWVPAGFAIPKRAAELLARYVQPVIA